MTDWEIPVHAEVGSYCGALACGDSSAVGYGLDSLKLCVHMLNSPNSPLAVGVLADLVEGRLGRTTPGASVLTLKNIEKHKVFGDFVSKIIKNTRFLPPPRGAPPKNLRKPMVF